MIQDAKPTTKADATKADSSRSETKQDSNQYGGFVVTAPYITVRAKDSLGNEVLQGFYAGGVLPKDVNTDDLDKHVRKGMVAERGSKEADAATPFGAPVSFDEFGNPLTPQQAEQREAEREQRRAEQAGRPHGNASRDTWAAFAATKGAPEDETRPVEAGGLSRDELRARYGG